MASTQVHVVYSDPDWKVEHEGLAHSYHFTKDAATCAGRALAQQVGAELVVHGIDGSIHERMSCTHEVHPSAARSMANR